MTFDWFMYNYPDCPPLAYVMRECFPWRWFRIHSLPESKRYPESDIDESMLLSRHNRVATDILGDGADCIFMVTRRVLDTIEPIYFTCANNFTKVYRYDDGEDFGGANTVPWVSWASPITWSPQKFDKIILAVANEEIYNTMFISPNHGGIYIPYDGGADLFHIDPMQINEIKARYQEWASKNPFGL